MIHAVTLGTRTRSVIRGVDPFYIWHSTPAKIIIFGTLHEQQSNGLATEWRDGMCQPVLKLDTLHANELIHNLYDYLVLKNLPLVWQQWWGVVVALLEPSCPFSKTILLQPDGFHIKDWNREWNYEYFFTFLFLGYWLDLTLRKDLNLFISGLQFPDPPCRKWIKVDFGSEGRGLQRGDYYFALVRMFFGGVVMYFGILTWRTDLVWGLLDMCEAPWVAQE